MPILFFKTWEGELTIRYQNIHIELVNFEVSLFIFFDREWYPIWYNFHKNEMHYFMFLNCLSLYNIVKMPFRIQSICLFFFLHLLNIFYWLQVTWLYWKMPCPKSEEFNFLEWTMSASWSEFVFVSMCK